jgi:flavin-dependent dehydrogenase
MSFNDTIVANVPSEVDVAVIGSGPAGTVTALELARASVRVALIERAANPVAKVGEALPPRVKPILRSLGLWEKFLGDSHLPCHSNRSAWGASRLQEHHFIFDPDGSGWHVDRTRFDAMLATAAVEAGATPLCGTAVVGWQPSLAGWYLAVRRLGRTETIRTRFIVDAGGRGARFARAQGVTRNRHDRLVGLVARFAEYADGSQDSYTLVETVQDGWWYSARLPGGKLIAIYMTDADLVSPSLARTAGGWQNLLNAARHTRARIERCVPEGRPAFAPADSAALDQAAGDAWLAVGDCAASYDPLSSQGLVTALEAGQEAARAVCGRLGGERDALAAYAVRSATLYRDYLAQHLAYYQTERRWPSSLFWLRRQHRERTP